MKKIIMIALVATIFMVSSGPLLAFDRDVEIVSDIFLVRPVGIAATVIGAAAFLVALPFSLPSGSVQETGRVLVAEPFKYTFSRPIGDFENRCNNDQMSIR